MKPGRLRLDPTALEALKRLRGWTRERFALAAQDTVQAAEKTCEVPGCPPLQTVVIFWTAPGGRHQFKVFKPAAEVLPADLPYAWMKDALRADGDFDCC